MLGLESRSIAGLSVAFGLAVAAPAMAETNMLFILDSSNSMWGQIDGTAKIATAKSVLANLLTDLPADTKVGLMAYGHRTKGDCGDVELLAGIGAESTAGLLQKIKGIAPKGKTPIAASLAESEGAFANIMEENNHVVLISDGIETCAGDPCKVAADLSTRGLNVRVHVVGFDVDADARRQLQCIAEAGNGMYFDAQSAQALRQAVAEVRQVAEAEPESEPEPKPAPGPVEVFFDDFDGEVLADHWEVLNPNPDSYIVEEGELLVITSKAADLAQENIENFFRLSDPLPKSNWTATVRLRIDFQTGQEQIFFGVYDDKDNYLVSVLYPFPANSGYYLFLSRTKASKGDITSASHNVWTPPDDLRADMNKGMAQGQPILLRLEKKGRDYISAIKMEGDEGSDWIEFPSLKSLRLKGSLAVGLFQKAAVSGETSILVDWIKIEVPGE